MRALVNCVARLFMWAALRRRRLQCQQVLLGAWRGAATGALGRGRCEWAEGYA